MATKAGSIFIEFTGDDAKLNATLNKMGGNISRAAESWTTSLEGINKAFERLSAGLSGIAGALGVGAIVEAGQQFVELATETLSSVDSLAKVSDQIGITTDQLQKLQYAASQSSTSQETLTTNLERLTRTIGEAVSGSKAQQEAFKGLGVSFLDASGHARDTHDVLLDLADAISKLPTQAQRAAAEVAIFGRAGQEMDAFMRQGASGVEELENKAQSLGLVLGQDEVEAAKRADSQIEGLRLQWERLTQHIIIDAVPALEKFVGWLAKITNPMDTYRDKLLALDKQIEATKLAIKADEHAFTIFGLISNGADAAKAHLIELEKEASGLRSLFEDVGGEKGARGLLPAKPTPPPPTVTATGTHKKTEEEKQAEAVAKVIDALRAETEAVGQDAEQQRLLNALRQAGVTAESAQGQAIHAEWVEWKAATEAQKAKADADRQYQEDLKSAQQLLDELTPKTDKLAESQKRLDEDYAEGLIDDEQYAAAQAELAKQIAAATKTNDEFQKQLDEMNKTIGTDLGSSLADLALGTKKWQAVMQDALRSILNDLMKLLDTANGKGGSGGLLGFLGNIGSAVLGSIFGGGGVDFGKAELGGNFATPYSSMTVQTAAEGGQFSAGQWGVVGEEGPELVRFGRAATVFPNGTGPGGNTIHIDARGADMAAVARLEMVVRDLHRSIEPRAIAAVSAERKRGGAFTASFRR